MSDNKLMLLPKWSHSAKKLSKDVERKSKNSDFYLDRAKSRSIFKNDYYKMLYIKKLQDSNIRLGDVLSLNTSRSGNNMQSAIADCLGCSVLSQRLNKGDLSPGNIEVKSSVCWKDDKNKKLLFNDICRKGSEARSYLGIYCEADDLSKLKVYKVPADDMEKLVKMYGYSTYRKGTNAKKLEVCMCATRGKCKKCLDLFDSKYLDYAVSAKFSSWLSARC